MEAAPRAQAMVTPGEGIAREVIATFFANGIKMMSSDATRQLLKDPAAVPAPGKKLIELQRAQWDPLGVDRDLGCAQLDNLEKLFPGDQAILQDRNDFVVTAQRTFLRAMEDRRPKKLERKKPMPREVMIDFFDLCNTKMDLPETHQLLRRHLETTKLVPNQLIINMQRELLEVMGFEQEHGCNMLSRAPQDFPNDRELLMRFEIWQRKAQGTLMQVVRAHQFAGGEIPAGIFGDTPEMQQLQGKAKEELAAMTPLERGALLQKMQKKVEIFMNLPEQNRADYMKKLVDEDKLEFVKTQLLLVNLMRQQWEAGKASSGSTDGRPEASQPSTYCGPEALTAPCAEAKPPQQQMM